VILQELQRLPEAIACYEESLKIDRDDRYAWYNAACCYAALGQQQKAIDCLREALDIEPDICGELARNNFVFDGLRQNETFNDLLSCYSPS
jgi:tetratricopeptide (TPR) repeat protein